MRRHELEHAQLDLAKLKSELSNLKLRHDGSSSRIKILQRECSDSREKLRFCLEKGDNDDKLISALQNAKNSKVTAIYTAQY